MEPKNYLFIFPLYSFIFFLRYPTLCAL